jgi:hypothetical protein
MHSLEGRMDNRLDINFFVAILLLAPVYFLELSGVGRIMENVMDDEEVQATERNRWII